MANKNNNFFTKFSDFREKTSFKINSLKQETFDSFSKFGKIIHFHKFWNHIKKYSMVHFLIFLVVLFTILTNGDFLKPDGISLLFKNNSYITILSMGMLLVIVSGNIDLSIGTMVGFLGILSVPVYDLTGSMIATFIIVMLIGMCLGIGQGFFIGYVGIPAFVVTLGGFLIYAGAQLAYTSGSALVPIDKIGFQNAVVGTMPDFHLGGSFYLFAFLVFVLIGLLIISLRFYGYISKRRAGLKTSKLWVLFLTQSIIAILFIFFAVTFALTSFGLPYFVIYTLVFIAIFTFVTQNTTFGRAVYAIGGNRKAAKLSGVNLKSTVFFIFVIMGILGGFAGVVLAGITGSVTSNTGGDIALSVISSVFIGGASVYGGIGSVANTVIGSSIIEVISYGLTWLRLTDSTKNIVKGIILILAVGWYSLVNKKNN